jgi:nucleotide sugar dehydrogenase
MQRTDRNRTFIVAVPTPLSGCGFDDRPLLSAVEAVRKVALPDDLLVLKSTVPIGTTRSISKTLVAVGGELLVAYCPDRSISGRAFEEQFSVPHIVGATSPAAQARAVKLFSLLGRVIIVGSPDAAEAVKLFTNAQRDVMFALANEFALMCESLGLDMYEIAQAGAVDYPRDRLARPGPVGGACLSKDTFLLAASAAIANAPTLPLAARAVNEEVVTRAAEWITAQLTIQNEEARLVAMFGVAFKGVPVTTDVRGSVAVSLMRLLRQMIPSVVVRVWDAAVSPDTLADCGFLPSSDVRSAAKDVSVIVVANDHPVFRLLPVGELAAVMRKPACIYDLCGTLGRIVEVPDGVTIKTFGVGDLPGAAVGHQPSSTNANAAKA